jgi:hypothetical protein
VVLLAGCPGSLVPSAKKEEPAAPPAVAEGAPAEGAPAPAAPPQQNMLKREAELVDRNKYLAEHPNAIEMEKNEINATGYFDAVGQGYRAGVTTLTTSTYEYDLRLWREMNNGRWPTFAEYKEILDRNGVKFKGTKLNQVYGYDDQTGQLSILELPEENAP